MSTKDPKQNSNKTSEGSTQMNQGDRSKQHAASPDNRSSNQSSLAGKDKDKDKDKDRSSDTSGSSSRGHQDRNH